MLEMDWITLTALVVGTLVVGILLGRLWSSARHESTASLKRQLDEMKQQHQNYQINVTEHFNRTTELIDTLNQNYDAIRDHLNRGATELTEPEHRLTAARDLDGDLQALAPEKEPAEPRDTPRDYAPKKAEDSGTLSEHYGLQSESDTAAEASQDEKTESHRSP